MSWTRQILRTLSALCIALAVYGAMPHVHRGAGDARRGAAVAEFAAFGGPAGDATSSLTPDDADSAVDAYEWNDGTLQLLSRPDWAAPAEPLWSAYPVAITRDGTRAVFVSAEKLTDDPDRWGSENLYVRDAGGLRLITRRPAGVGADQTASFIGQGFSPDGSQIYFLTERSLAPDDTDSLDFDLYAYSFPDGSTRLISGTSLAPPGPTSSTPQVRATSTDGSTVVFSTDESLLPADQNSEVDVYVSRRGAGLRLLTARSPALGGGAVGTNTYERVAAVDPGAQRILFTSTIPLLPEDQGGQGDLYAWNDGILSAIAPAPVRADERSRLYVTGTSADLRRIFLSTRQNLTADDPPGMDLFEWRGGAVQRGGGRPAGGCHRGRRPSRSGCRDPLTAVVVVSGDRSGHPSPLAVIVAGGGAVHPGSIVGIIALGRGRDPAPV